MTAPIPELPMRSPLLLFGVAALFLALAKAPSFAQKKPLVVEPPPESPSLEPEVQKAWRDLGAEPLWSGRLRGLFAVPSKRKDGLIDSTPAFVFSRPMKGDLTKTPQPNVSFAVIADGTASMAPAQIAQLKTMTNLVRLAVAAPAVAKPAPGVIPGLGDLNSLEHLAVTAPQGDDVLVDQEIYRLPKLRTLQLTGGRYTEKGLAKIAAMNTIECLSLQFVPLTDAGFQRISRITRLKVLSVTSTGDAKGSRITKEAAEAIAQCPNLEELHLRSAGVSKDALRTISGMHQLKSLSLESETVPDAELDDLYTIKSLRYLNLTNSKISPAGLKSLAMARGARTNLTIIGPK